MLKGVNKRIIEISNIENEYFYKALLFVNTKAPYKSDKKLEAEANNYINELICKKRGKILPNGYLRKRKKLKQKLFLLLSVFAVFAGVAILSLILKS